jgi:hypothetical protein
MAMTPEPSLFEVETPVVELYRCGRGEVGTHFIEEREGHECKPACYRAGKHGITFLCECGHSAGFHDGRGSFGGSWAEDLANRLPVHAPFRIA